MQLHTGQAGTTQIPGSSSVGVSKTAKEEEAMEVDAHPDKRYDESGGRAEHKSEMYDIKNRMDVA